MKENDRARKLLRVFIVFFFIVNLVDAVSARFDESLMRGKIVDWLNLITSLALFLVSCYFVLILNRTTRLFAKIAKYSNQSILPFKIMYILAQISLLIYSLYHGLVRTIMGFLFNADGIKSGNFYDEKSKLWRLS